MRKHLLLASLLAAVTVTAMPISASAHDGWHRDWDDQDEWREHHWRDRDDDDWRWRHRWHHAHYVIEEPTYVYEPQPVYVAPPPPRVVYYEPQPVFSFYFGR